MESAPTFSIQKLATYRESNRLEVKSAKGGLPNSLWETYSAFANSEGGVIVLGVKEKKDGRFLIDGLDDPRKLLKDFWNIVNNRQKVSCNILTDSMVSIETVNGKSLLVIKVPRAERTTRPVYVGMDPRLGSFRRNGDGDYRCSLEEVSLMLRDSSPTTDDYRLLTKLDFSVFCPDTIRAYRNIFRVIHSDHLWNKEDDVMFMRRIGAMREDKATGKFHPTSAGLLMFGYEYEIIEEFPQYFLDYQENRTNGLYARWTDRITSQTGDWSGNVFDFLLKVVPKLQSDLKIPFVFNGNQTVKDTPIHKALREAVVNMLTNADFYGRRGVVVQKNADGFKFANPGSMRVSLTEAVQDNISDPRNGVMLKMLAMVEYGERAGSGLHGIFTTWEQVYHTKPRIEVSTSGVDRTVLSLNFDGQQPDIQAMKLLYDTPRRQYTIDEGPVSIVQEPQSEEYGVRKGQVDPQNESDDPQNGKNDPQRYRSDPQKVANGPQNSINDPQNATSLPKNDPQSSAFDPQSSRRDPQKGTNDPQKEALLSAIRKNPNITRQKLGEMSGWSESTIKRRLKAWGIYWNGHPKTGHWVLPE